MKHSVLLAMLLILVGVNSQAAEPEVIKDKLDEINYSLGVQLGRKLLEKELEFRPDAVWQGVYDGVKDSLPYMSEELMRQTLQELQNEPAPPAAIETSEIPEAAEKRETKEVVAYRLKGQKFIAENLQKEGVKSLQSGVQYKVLKSGQGRQPKPTDTVLVDYKAKTVEGTVFNSSYPLGISTPVEFKVDSLIPGLTEVLPMMKEGDKWEIYIPTRMAYKDAGPMAGQTVIYEMELLEILPEFR